MLANLEGTQCKVLSRLHLNYEQAPPDGKGPSCSMDRRQRKGAWSLGMLVSKKRVHRECRAFIAKMYPLQNTNVVGDRHPCILNSLSP